MKEEELNRVREETKDWPYLEALPENILSFRLRRIEEENDDMYDLFAYENEERHRSLTAYYHAETFEYKARICVGSFTFCHTSFITPSFEAFTEILKSRLEGILSDMENPSPEKVGSVLKASKLSEWDATKLLPEELEGFSLFIRPSAPLPITNGSYVVFDYEHFASGSNFAVYYNIFRDEFFGDARVAAVPEMDYDFDSKSLSELSGKLAEKLAPRLADIRRRAEREISP